MDSDAASHYDRLAKDYNTNWVYSADFVEWMNRQISRRLKVSHGDRVVDIGCGTGLYSESLAHHSGEVVCVDPSIEMLKQLPKHKNLRPINASVEDVVSGRVTLPYDHFDAILIKEAIHHFGDRSTVLQELARRLAPHGRMLIVMLPTIIEYPLFSAALELFERLQPDPEGIAMELRQSDLNANVQYESFALSLDKARYLQMVRSRYMSLLSSFSDEEIELGVAEIESKYPGSRMSFGDRQAFVLACAP